MTPPSFNGFSPGTFRSLDITPSTIKHKDIIVDQPTPYVPANSLCCDPATCKPANSLCCDPATCKPYADSVQHQCAPATECADASVCVYLFNKNTIAMSKFLKL